MKAQSEQEEHLLTGATGRLFVVASLGWFFLRMGRGLLPTLLPAIVESLKITSVQAGFGLSILWALYALSQYPSGRLSDQLSRKTLLVASLLCMVAAFTVFYGSLTYHLFLLGAAVLGIGGGFYPTAARALISDMYSERRGQAYGVHGMLGSLGSAVAAGLAVLALAVADWRTAFLPVILGIGGVMIATHSFSREKYVFRRVDLALVQSFRRLFRDRQTLWLLLSYTGFSFTYQSTTSFLPTFLNLEKGFSMGIASGGFALLYIVGSAAKPVAGRLGDQFGRRGVAVGALVLGIVGLLGMLVAEGRLAVLASIGIFAAGLMAYPPVMIAHLMEVFPSDTMGGDYGAFRTIFIGLASLGPTYVGYVADVYSYTVAFAILGICLAASSAIVMALIFDE